MRFFLLFLGTVLPLLATPTRNPFPKPKIIQKPICFDALRTNLTQEYIAKHYGIRTKTITIVPQMIVVHWTALDSLTGSYARFYPSTLPDDRQDIAKASLLNVSAHFLIDKDGTIYQLMPETVMARHVIGLNYTSIGVENVGGKHNKEQDLTPAQLQANTALICYLQHKYPTIKYVIGHYEYRKFETFPLWLEHNPHYRTIKSDPGALFMQKLRKNLRNCL